MESQIVTFALRDGTEHSEVVAWQFHWPETILAARKQAERKGVTVCNVLKIVNSDGSVEFDPTQDLGHRNETKFELPSD